MNEELLKSEIRIWALECLVSQLYAMFYTATGDAQAAFETRKKTLIESARKQTFPGFDPAMSDLASAELEAAVERLLQMQQELLGTART